MPFDAFTVRLGASQGRIVPTGFPPVGDYAFVLGSDLANVLAKLKVGNFVQVAQTVDVTGMKYLHLVFRGRPPTSMPASRSAVDGSTNGAGTQLTSVSIAFTQNDVGSVVRSSGQPDATISAVSGNTATISPAWTGSLSGLSFSVLGVAWRFSLRVASIERAFHIITPGRVRDRIELAANVSKLTGNQAVDLRLELVAA